MRKLRKSSSLYTFGYKYSQSLWLFLLVILFLVAPLSRISALTISEEELQRLEAIFKELSTANATLQAQLNDSTALLLKAQASFNEYAKEAEKVVVDLQVEKDRLVALRNGWRAATLVTGAITVGVVLTFLLLK